jgi:hypothetical protein
MVLFFKICLYVHFSFWFWIWRVVSPILLQSRFFILFFCMCVRVRVCISRLAEASARYYAAVPHRPPVPAVPDLAREAELLRLMRILVDIDEGGAVGGTGPADDAARTALMRREALRCDIRQLSGDGGRRTASAGVAGAPGENCCLLPECGGTGNGGGVAVGSLHSGHGHNSEQQQQQQQQHGQHTASRVELVPSGRNVLAAIDELLRRQGGDSLAVRGVYALTRRADASDTAESRAAELAAKAALASNSDTNTNNNNNHSSSSSSGCDDGLVDVVDFGSSSVLMLHGTRPASLLSLIVQGPLPPPAVVALGGHRSDAGWLGPGIYLAAGGARAAEFSPPPPSGPRIMLVCEVWPGRVGRVVKRRDESGLYEWRKKKVFFFFFLSLSTDTIFFSKKYITTATPQPVPAARDRHVARHGLRGVRRPWPRERLSLGRAVRV